MTYGVEGDVPDSSMLNVQQEGALRQWPELSLWEETGFDPAALIPSKGSFQLAKQLIEKYLLILAH